MMHRIYTYWYIYTSYPSPPPYTLPGNNSSLLLHSLCIHFPFTSTSLLPSHLMNNRKYACPYDPIPLAYAAAVCSHHRPWIVCKCTMRVHWQDQHGETPNTIKVIFIMERTCVLVLNINSSHMHWRGLLTGLHPDSSVFLLGFQWYSSVPHIICLIVVLFDCRQLRFWG